MNSLQGETLLKYRNYRYLKVTVSLALLAVVVYLLTVPDGGEAYGGTWLGYVTGIAATLLIFVLMAYGVARRSISGSPERRQYAAVQAGADSGRTVERRKRSARANRLEGGTLQGWLSAISIWAHCCWCW